MYRCANVVRWTKCILELVVVPRVVAIARYRDGRSMDESATVDSVGLVAIAWVVGIEAGMTIGSSGEYH